MDGDVVRTTVRNTGNRDGETVIQVYAGCESPLAPKHPKLCGFGRIAVNAGETREISIRLDPLTWTVVDEQGVRQTAEHGILYVGLYQPDARSTELTGASPVQIKK